MKKPHSPISNLGKWAHSPKSTNYAGPTKDQVGNMSPKLIGKNAPPATVSKTRTKGK
jgi:hypothetical protein